MVTLVMLGKFMETAVSERHHEAIRKVYMELAPDTAILYENGKRSG